MTGTQEEVLRLVKCQALPEQVCQTVKQLSLRETSQMYRLLETSQLMTPALKAILDQRVRRTTVGRPDPATGRHRALL